MNLNSFGWILKVKYLIVSIFFAMRLCQSPNIQFLTDPDFFVSHHTLISPFDYTQKTSNIVVLYDHSPNSFNPLNCEIFFGLTTINFGQSSASFSFDLNVVQQQNTFFKIKFDILNQTVIYSLKAKSVIMDLSNIPEIYYFKGVLNCKVLSQGTGLRSQNISIPLYTKPFFYPEVAYLRRLLYIQGLNLFNPKGTYFHFVYETPYNATHMTLNLITSDQNIVSFVHYSMIIIDQNYNINFKSRKRIFYMTHWICTSNDPSCFIISGGTAIPNIYHSVGSYLIGLGNFKFLKNAETRFQFDTSDLSNLISGYSRSDGILSTNFSITIMALRDCNPNSLYYDEDTKDCTNNCGATSKYFLPENTPLKTCRKCHHSCKPWKCSDSSDNKCTECDPTKFRQQNPASAGTNFQCDCMTGYVDLGLQQCSPCTKYLPGCAECSAPLTCTVCNSGLQLDSNNKCVCSSPLATLTRDGRCKSVIGCLTYFTDPVQGEVCIECNKTGHYFLSNYGCACEAGYQVATRTDGSKYCKAETEVCGDGIRTVSELCDDHNQVIGDGCDSNCVTEPGFLCFGNLRETSFCLESRTTFTYVGAMKIQGEKIAELYFSLKPYNEYLDDVGFLSKFVSTSISTFVTFTNPFFRTRPNLDEDELQIILHFDYTEAVNDSIEHNLKFFVSDDSQTFTRETKFYIKGANLQLTLSEGYDNMVFMNYLILAFIILGFIALFISLFSENWIGIELIHTFQFCFFYFVLLEDIDEKQVKYLWYLQFSNGYNEAVNDQLTLYEYLDFSKKTYLMNYRKEMMLNLNIATLIFAIPFILLMVKLLRPVFMDCFTSKSEKNQQNSKAKTQKAKYPSKLDYFLSSEFIVGKLFVTFNLVFMNQILFSFFIEQTPNLQQDSVFDELFSQIFIFLMVSSVLMTIGLLIMAALRPYKFNSPDEDQNTEEVVEFIKYKRFEATYPLVYSIFVATKILFLSMFFTSKFLVYVILGVEISYLIGYCIFRPYKKIRHTQSAYCYALHNTHNIWNSFGLSVLISVIMMTNFNLNEDSFVMNLSIRFTVAIIEFVSLILAYLRLFTSKKFTKCRKQQIDFDQQNEFEDTPRPLKRGKQKQSQQIEKSGPNKVSKQNSRKIQTQEKSSRRQKNLRIRTNT